MQTSNSSASPLAINGGPPCVIDPPDSYLHGPMEIGDEEIAACTAVLQKKNMFRFAGDRSKSPTAIFEKQFAEMTQVTHALAVNSGTSALICAMIGLGISSGDEVIVPGHTYIATAAAALAVRAIPVIAEVDDTLTLDPDDIERKISPRTKAIVPVHMRGLPCQMDKIMAIARKHNLKVLEDCAQANGGSFHGKPLGSIGDAAAFSLQHFKIITAGEGGVFVTNDRTIYERGACYHDSAYTFWMERQVQMTIPPFLGENYRLSELHGAVALAQLQKRDRILARTRAIKRRMIDAIGAVPGLTHQKVCDTEGDCGISLVMYADTPQRAKWFASALKAEGRNASSIYDKGIPDRHVYYHWDYVMNKRTPDAYGYPWHDPNRPCEVKYSKDMCPRTLDFLGRTVICAISQRMSDAHVDSCIAAFHKVAKHA